MTPNALNSRPWHAADPTTWLFVPTRTYLFGLVVLIGILLLLSGDFGRSWDMSVHDFSGRRAYDFYFGGFDAEQFTQNQHNIAYGPAVDVIIKLAQDLTSDSIEKFKIRVVLEALLSLSCLIPVFLISARVLQRPLAIIAVALVLGTPVFFGHAFINPKDSLAMSGLLWSLWLIFRCFEQGKPNYRSLVGLGVLLGLTASIRYVTAYLVLLIPVAIALARQDGNTPPEGTSLRRLAEFPYGGLAILFLTFAIAYTLMMPVILTSFGLQAYMDVLSKFAHIGWNGNILYFGQWVSAQHLPWHYVYGYMVVQLPLYYHLFAVTLSVAAIGWPRRTMQTFRAFYAENPPARSTLILLLAGLVIPCVLIALVRPVLYDGFRHVLFIVPLLCMLLYFGFAIVLRQIGKICRGLLIALASACWIQSVAAMVWLHPYEYAYYNPLVDPSHSFELDYWGTSFREIAERLNEYARQNATGGEKLRVWVCGPVSALKLFLDQNRFEVVDESNAQLKVLLNRGECLNVLKTPPLISVGRDGLVFAVAGRS